MPCICPIRETPTFVSSKKIGINGSKLFAYYLCIHENFSKRLEPNISSSWFTRYREYSEDYPMRNFRHCENIVNIPISA